MADKKRLIDANDLKLAIRDDPFIDGKNYAMMKRHINEAKTVDAVEVVLCRDCKHFTEGMAVGMCKRMPDKPILPIPYDHFCSFGERKDNGL